jgi:hypothetical protein
MKIHPQDSPPPPSPTAMNPIQGLTPITFLEFERQATILLAPLASVEPPALQTPPRLVQGQTMNHVIIDFGADMGSVGQDDRLFYRGKDQ